MSSRGVIESKGDDVVDNQNIHQTVSSESVQENGKSSYLALNILQNKNNLNQIYEMTLEKITTNNKNDVILPTYLNHNHFKEYENMAQQNLIMSTILSQRKLLIPDNDNYDSSPLLFHLIPYLMKTYKYNEVTNCTLMQCLGRYNNYIGYKERGVQYQLV